jgi:hypothetical protein
MGAKTPGRSHNHARGGTATALQHYPRHGESHFFFAQNRSRPLEEMQTGGFTFRKKNPSGLQYRRKDEIQEIEFGLDGDFVSRSGNEPGGGLGAEGQGGFWRKGES